MKSATLFFAFTLFLALSVPAQTIPEPRDVSMNAADSVHSNQTATGIQKPDSSAFIKPGAWKEPGRGDWKEPGRKRPHPVAIGCGVSTVGAVLLFEGFMVGFHNSLGGNFTQSREDRANLLAISGTILAVGGVAYLIIGQIYNHNVMDENAVKKAAVHRSGVTPELSFTKSGDLHPSVSGWVSF